MDKEFEGVPSTKRDGTYPHELQVRSHSCQDCQLYVPSVTELDSGTGVRQRSRSPTKTPSQNIVRCYLGRNAMSDLSSSWELLSTRFFWYSSGRLSYRPLSYSFWMLSEYQGWRRSRPCYQWWRFYPPHPKHHLLWTFSRYQWFPHYPHLSPATTPH